MGKASRRKRDPTRRGGIEVDRWLSSVGIVDLTDVAFAAAARARVGDSWLRRWSDAPEGLEASRRLEYESLDASLLVESLLRSRQHRAWLNWLAGCLPADSPNRIVDVGAGIGLASCWLAARYPEADVIGLDNDDAACAVAAQLANRLKLENIRFVTDTQVADADLVVGALVAHEIDPGLLEFDPPDPFRSLRSIELLLQQPRPSAATAVLAGCLGERGRLLTLSRGPVPESDARWLGALHVAGLEVSAFGRASVRVADLDETLTFVDAIRSSHHAPPSAALVVDAWRGYDGLEVERRIEATGAHELIWAIEMDYRTGGTERMEILATADQSQFVAWATTSLGARRFLANAADVGAVNVWQAEMRSYAADRRTDLVRIEEGCDTTSQRSD